MKSPLIRLLLCAPLLIVLGCHRTHAPSYSEAEELKFRADEAQELAGPRGDLAQLRNGVIEGSTSIGNEPGSRVKLDHWSGRPMEVVVNGADVVVAKPSGDALLDGSRWWKPKWFRRPRDRSNTGSPAAPSACA